MTSSLFQDDASSNSQQFQTINELLSTEISDNNENDSVNKCTYCSISEITSTLNPADFNLFSLNTCSLPSQIDNLNNFFTAEASNIFSAISIQEVWSAKRTLSISGFSPLIYKTRDQFSSVNGNCGGGVAMFIKSGLQYEILDDLSEFIPGVYESLWIKLKPNSIKSTKSIILGNVYRPNSAPKANITLALSTHFSILEKIKRNKAHKGCKIIVASDFNIDLLTFATNVTSLEYINSHFAKGLIPVISLSAHITATSAKVIDHIFVCDPPPPYKTGVLKF